jgi:hypothetical protein
VGAPLERHQSTVFARQELQIVRGTKPQIAARMWIDAASRSGSYGRFVSLTAHFEAPRQEHGQRVNDR